MNRNSIDYVVDLLWLEINSENIFDIRIIAYIVSLKKKLFSCIPFLVNLFLALRFFHTEWNKLNYQEKRVNLVIDLCRVVAYNIYYLTCIINWSIHILYFISCFYYYTIGVGELFYMIILIPIINDDLILLSWLKDKKYNL